MYQKFMKNKATANKNSAMESRDHSKNGVTKIKIILLGTVFMILGMLGVQAQSSGSTIDMADNNPPASGTGWTYSSSVYTIVSGATNVTIKGANASLRRIVVNGGANVTTITLNGVTIQGLAANQPAMLLNSGANVTLTLVANTTNTLTSGNYSAGIQTTGAVLTINGSGSLVVKGGNASDPDGSNPGNGAGAGIGGSGGISTTLYGGSGGAITIYGGTITSNGGNGSNGGGGWVGGSGGRGGGGGGAGIGGGGGGGRGGQVNSNSNGNAGGGGGTINIYGGTVTTIGGNLGSGGTGAGIFGGGGGGGGGEGAGIGGGGGGGCGGGAATNNGGYSGNYPNSGIGGNGGNGSRNDYSGGSGGSAGTFTMTSTNGGGLVFASEASISGNKTGGILVFRGYDATYWFHSNAFTMGYTGTIPSGYSLTIGSSRSFTIPQDVTLTNSGTLTTANNGTLAIGNNSTSGAVVGNITNNGSVQFNRSNNYTYSGIISGAGVVTKLGAGILYLTGSNTYTGTTTISAGTLSIGNNTTEGAVAGNITNNSNLYFYRSNAYTYSGIISGTGTVNKLGTNTTTFNGVNTYTGTTTIENGTLALGTNGTIQNSSSVTINIATGKLDISAANKTIKALHGTNASAEVVLGTRTLTIGTSGQSDGGGTFAGRITGTGNVVKRGTSTLILTGTNNYSGSTNIYEGILQIGNSTSTTATINSTSEVYLASTSSVLCFEPGAYTTFSKQIWGSGRVEYNGSSSKPLYLTGSNTYSGTTTITTGGYLYIGSGGTTGSVTGNIINNGTLWFSRSNSYTYNGVISGTGSVYQNGTSSSSVTLGGVNAYTGITYIDAPLILSTSGSIATSSSVTLRNYAAAKLDISTSTANKTIKALNSEGANGEVMLGGRTLTIGTSGLSDGTGTFSGKFTGTGGGVTKLGTGILTLNNASNTANGAFTHSEGTVKFSGNWAGNYTKSTNANFEIIGTVNIGGNMTLAGGNTTMNLTGSNPAKLITTGAINASGNNTLIITSTPVTNYVLFQASSGITTTSPYTLNLSGMTGRLDVNSPTQLLLIRTSIITATAGANGSISPNGSIAVDYGVSQTFTFTPVSSCYEIDQVLVNGVNNPTAVATGSYTFTNVTTTHTIHVTFKNKSFTQNNPTAASICYNSTHTFNLAAAVGGSGTITYQWQSSTNN